MAGYNGWSMSNNAVQAYEDGEKPLSKWTKQTFIETIAGMTGKDEEEVKKALKPYAVSTLRSQLLSLSSWHHTSSHLQQDELLQHRATGNARRCPLCSFRPTRKR